MTERSAVHATFTIDRTYDAAPRRVFAAFATETGKAAGSGTRLILTEQGVFFDGYDDAGSREHGTGVLMDRMAASLSQPV
jgi:uncharacterized protein YndB with AHSA1/START domain